MRNCVYAIVHSGKRNNTWIGRNKIFEIKHSKRTKKSSKGAQNRPTLKVINVIAEQLIHYRCDAYETKGQTDQLRDGSDDVEGTVTR